MQGGAISQDAFNQETEATDEDSMKEGREKHAKVEGPSRNLSRVASVQWRSPRLVDMEKAVMRSSRFQRGQ